MKLTIANMVDRGVSNKERLHLKVLADANLVNYAVFDTMAASPTAVVSIPKRAYWFSSHLVKAGDSVILYTRAGTESAKVRTDGGTNHFLFWGLDQTLWNNPASRVVLVEITTWETSAP